jgi:hypothetical protein
MNDHSQHSKRGAKLALLLIAALTTLALSAPGAYAGTTKKPAKPGKAPKGATWSVFQDATGKITVRIGPRIIYIYSPAPAGQQISSSTDTSDDCAYYQANCTPEQDCQLWGVNCDLITNTNNHPQQSSEQSPAGDSVTTLVQVDNAPAEPTTDSSATDLSATTTTANLVDPIQDPDQDC